MKKQKRVADGLQRPPKAVHPPGGAAGGRAKRAERSEVRAKRGTSEARAKRERSEVRVKRYKKRSRFENLFLFFTINSLRRNSTIFMQLSYGILSPFFFHVFWKKSFTIWFNFLLKNSHFLKAFSDCIAAVQTVKNVYPGLLFELVFHNWLPLPCKSYKIHKNDSLILSCSPPLFSNCLCNTYSNRANT